MVYSINIMRVHNKERYTMNKDFAMFSEKGNDRVYIIFMSAVLGECNVEWVINKLTALGKDKRFEEATDTAVRDRMFEELSNVYKGVA